MRTLQTIILITATLTTGLMAGLYAAFAYSAMPGLGRSSDKAYVEVMQNINRAILNPVFMLLFFGSAIFIGVAIVLSWNGHGRDALPWLITALVLYVGMLAITFVFNVPLNNDLDKAGDPDKIDVAAVRDAFHTKWVTWNIIRGIVNLAAFGVLAYALILFGRETADDADAAPPPAGPQVTAQSDSR